MKVRNYLNMKKGVEETHGEIKVNNPEVLASELFLLSTRVVGEVYGDWKYLGFVDRPVWDQRKQCYV